MADRDYPFRMNKKTSTSIPFFMTFILVLALFYSLVILVNLSNDNDALKVVLNQTRIELQELSEELSLYRYDYEVDSEKQTVLITKEQEGFYFFESFEDGDVELFYGDGTTRAVTIKVSSDSAVVWNNFMGRVERQIYILEDSYDE